MNIEKMLQLICTVAGAVAITISPAGTVVLRATNRLDCLHKWYHHWRCWYSFNPARLTMVKRSGTVNPVAKALLQTNRRPARRA